MNSLESRLEKFVTFDEPRPVMTKRGGTILRTGVPSDDFWELWARHKLLLRKMGVCPRKIDGEWQVAQFMDGQLHEITTENDMMNTAGLMSWQIRPMKHLVGILREHVSAMDSSDTGTGKTFVACAVARQLGLKLGVICPKAVIPSWAEAAKHIGAGVRFILNYEALKSSKGLKFVRWSADGHPIWLMRRDEPILLVFDEAHRCKDPAISKNAMLMISAAVQKIRHLLVSATIAESPLHLRAAGYSLGLHSGKDFWDWCVRLGCWKDAYNGWHFNGGQNAMKKIREMIFPRKGVRVRVEDLGDKFPRTIVTADLIEAEGVDRIYKKLIERVERVERETSNYAQSVFTEILGARRRVELLKVPAMVSMAKDAMAEGSSVALFACFNDTIEAICAELRCPSITGATPAADRERLKKEFQADKIPALALNIAAGGVGISLHGKRHRVALISPSWSAFELIQCLGRVHRAGGAHSVQRILFASGTIEEQICRKVRAKIGRLETLNDGDTAGIQITRHASPKPTRESRPTGRRQLQPH